METLCPERESTVTAGILPFIFIHLSQSCRVFYFLCCYAKVGCFFLNYSKRKPSCSGRLTCTLLSLWFKRTFSGVRSLHHGSLLLLQGFLAEVEPGKLLENENGNMMNLTEGCPLSSHFKASSHTAQSGTLVLCLFDLSFRHVQSIYMFKHMYSEHGSGDGDSLRMTIFSFFAFLCCTTSAQVVGIQVLMALWRESIAAQDRL